MTDKPTNFILYFSEYASTNAGPCRNIFICKTENTLLGSLSSIALFDFMNY